MAPRCILLAAMAATAATAETVHNVLVFTRHGDRTAKFYSGYAMTNLGANQVYSSGNFYRERYIEEGASNQIAGISPGKVVASQVWASAPDQGILYQTATNFLQGLYPPLGDIDSELAIETLVNGTQVEDPLNGYQYILIHGEGADGPDTIWIKGDDECPAYTTSYKSYSKSSSYQATLDASTPIYDSVSPILAPIMGAENVSFSHAYDVFDLLNVAAIHNSSVAPEINPSTLDELRYLANEWEWNNNFNASQPVRSVGGMTLAGGILKQLQDAVDAEGEKFKFNLLAGSYDTFLAFFGVTNLSSQSADFQGLPNYASSMVFELYSDGEDFPTNPREDLYVRWLFRNGSESNQELTSYALFGQSELTLPYGQFVDELSSRSVNSVRDWCALCGSEQDFCVAANATAGSSSDGAAAGSSSSSSSNGGSGLSNAAAGAIGAVVALAVVAIIGGLFWLVKRRKTAKTTPAATAGTQEKRTSSSETDSSPERTHDMA